MGNKLTERIKIGTLGELLVQLRLLQFGVQAAPPIKDSGNDLIAVRGEAFRGIQVKTTAAERFAANNLPEHWHILALVSLISDDSDLFLDRSEIYLIPRIIFEAERSLPKDLTPYRISQHLIEQLFK